jgi:hypothetical protein
MRTLFVTFTCRRDLPLLPLWAESIRRAAAASHHPRPILIAALDHLDPAADAPLPRGIHRHVTTFERKGNLNGVPAVTGILSTLYSLAQQHRCQVAVKVDSDTILTRLQWLEPAHHTPAAGYIGLEGEAPLSATGIAYALRADYLAHLLSHVIPWPWHTSGHLPEDRTICSLATLHRRAVLLPWSGGKYCAAFMPHYFSDPSPLRTVAAAIHCGQASALQTYGSAIPRTTLVARQMRACLRCLWHPSSLNP